MTEKMQASGRQRRKSVIVRYCLKLLIVIGVGAFGYHLAESFGIDGVWGALAGGILAATVINKLFGK